VHRDAHATSYWNLPIKGSRVMVYTWGRKARHMGQKTGKTKVHRQTWRTYDS